jgi:glutaminyl-peptide cyclotransferase
MATLFCLFSFFSIAYGQPQTFKVNILRQLTHEGAPWTQGLELVDQNTLLETCGSYPPGVQSEIRQLDRKTGKVLSSTGAGMSGRFIEGIARNDKGWIASTYTDHKAVQYDSQLNVLQEYDYPLQGWGLARRAGTDTYYATDGSATVSLLDRNTMQPIDSKPARCMGKPVAGLNELEMISGDFMGLGPTLLGNVYQTRIILGLNPDTMECNSVFHIKSLGNIDLSESMGFHVPNGIAFLHDTSTLMVTGKNWKEMFEISLEKVQDGETLSMLNGYLGAASLIQQNRRIERYSQDPIESSAKGAYLRQQTLSAEGQ